MRRQKYQSSADANEVDLTPLIDVVFVVLIMFILVAPMLEIDKVHLSQAGQKEQKEPANTSDLVIHVREDNTVLLNKQVINKDNLDKLLCTLYQKNPKCIPQLYQDYQAHFGTYQMIKNALENAGYSELDVVLEPGK